MTREVRGSKRAERPSRAAADEEAKRVEIISAMKRLRRRLEAGDDSELLHWVLASRLAVAQRPLRHHPRFGGSGAPIPREARALVEARSEQIRRAGIRSIISFMHARDVQSYRESFEVGDLMDFLEDRGFVVRRLPWEDPARARKDARLIAAKREEIVAAALKAFHDLPAGVLLQCSAGIDRSAPAAARIWSRAECDP